MINNFDITFEETVDPRGVNCGEEHYNDYGCSRDPERTPFQWDTTENAGFTDGDSTWDTIQKGILLLWHVLLWHKLREPPLLIPSGREMRVQAS